MAFFSLAKSSLAQLAPRAIPAIVRPALLSRALSTYPSDRKYVKSHEWAKLDGDVATVGITSHAQGKLGEIVFADLPDIGSEAVAGSPAAALESVKAAADIYAPVAGEVVEVNGALEDTPNLINDKPHDDGWMFKIKVSDATALDALLDSESYSKSLDKE